MIAGYGAVIELMDFIFNDEIRYDTSYGVLPVVAISPMDFGPGSENRTRFFCFVGVEAGFLAYKHTGLLLSIKP